MILLDYETEAEAIQFIESVYNTTKDIDKTVDDTAKKYKITNKYVLQLLPRDLYINYLINSKAIPDIDSYNFLESVFDTRWLNSCGNID